MSGYLEEFFFSASVILALAAIVMLPHTIRSDAPWTSIQIAGGASVSCMLVAVVLKYRSGSAP